MSSRGKIFSLVKFFCGEWKILNDKEVKRNPINGYVGKYRGTYYSVELIHQSNNKNILNNLKFNITNNIPYILLNKLNCNVLENVVQADTPNGILTGKGEL